MKLWQWAFVGTFLAIFFGLSIFSAKQESLTYDEIVYTEEGRAIFSVGNFSIDPYNPPFTKELMAPSGRITTIIFGTFLLFFVFLVTNSYFGISSALFTLFLLTFEPNLLGNSHYVTLDIGFSFFFFLSYIFLLKLIHQPRLKYAIVLGLMLGAMLGSKISAIPYFFVSMFLLLIWKRKLITELHRKYFFLVFSLAVIVLWGTYFFKTDVIVVRHDNPNRVSNKLFAYGTTRNIVPLTWAIERLQNQKVPLGTYISIIKNNLIRSRNAKNIEPWYSMLTNILFKTPLPLLLFFALSIRKRRLPFLIPIGAILFTSSVSRMSPLVRYVLPLYPFMVIAASASLKEFRGIYRSLLFIGLIVWYAIGTINQFPHFISYANEFAGPREKRYEKFVDSNIDWGQGLVSLQEYISVKQPKKLLFSYFGRDNGDLYGLKSDKPWGSYKFEEICAFHIINFPKNSGGQLTAISISNWYYCGYSKEKIYSKNNIFEVVGDSILIFTY